MEFEAVKGLQGYWHATNGEWDDTGNKLKTLCGTSISPNFRRFNEQDVNRVVNCPKCKAFLRGLSDAKHEQNPSGEGSTADLGDLYPRV